MITRTPLRFAAASAVAVMLLVSCATDDTSSTDTTGATTTSSPNVDTTTSTSTPDAEASSSLPGLDASVSTITFDVPITLGDGTTLDATFDGLESGPDDGELVLLLHGFPQTSYEWRHQIAALGAAGYHAVAFDQRGYSSGARPTADADYSIILLAGDVLAVADELGADRFHLVGHDWGAGVAWTLAGVAPQRILTLNPVSVPHPAAMARFLADPDSEQSDKSSYVTVFSDPASAATFTADGGVAFMTGAFGAIASEEEIAVYIDALGTEEAMSAALAWYRATDFGAGGALPATVVPTMFVWSDGDCCLGRDSAEATVEFVDAPYRFEVIEGVSHWVPEEAADELTALLLDHLAG